MNDMMQAVADGLPKANQSEVNNKMNLARLPRLFKKTNTGAIQYWDIFVQEKQVDVPHPSEDPLAGTIKVAAGEIVTVYGQLGTTSPQRTSDVIKEGKNPGKRNATTALEQAAKECLAKWQKQKKKGYVESEEAARAEQIDTNLIAGGLFPMLAQKYRDHASKIAWPCYVQPKLNGHRCIAIVSNGKATLWSRKRKPITSMPHIIAELEANFTDVILDGELFNPQCNETSPDYTGPKTSDAMTLQELSGLVRAKAPEGRYAMVQYHVYDLVNDKKYVDRSDELAALMSQVDFRVVRPVQTGMVKDDAMVQLMMNDVRAAGYEGLMLRNAEGLYVQDKRSYDLQKVKKFVGGEELLGDEEFEIVGIKEGKGKLAGHVGSFICLAKNGKEFKAKLEGDTAFLKKCFEDHSLWKGKLLTVVYAELTPDGKPFHGVGKDIREKDEV